MYDLIESKHYIARCQQRFISGVLTDIILYYREARICRGGVDGIYFSRDSLHEILSDLGLRLSRLFVVRLFETFAAHGRSPITPGDHPPASCRACPSAAKAQSAPTEHPKTKRNPPSPTSPRKAR